MRYSDHDQRQMDIKSGEELDRHAARKVPMSRTKEERNARVQARYDELMREGKRGHYEALFRVVLEEVKRDRVASATIIEGHEELGEPRLALADQIRHRPD